ncbi:MAG: MASE1 domain-containing protein, partial [Myxococcales bacterium]|nr:MASE1 domain-containing protein [Myxococcales bacterium]
MKALGFARRRSVGEAALFFCAYLAASELGYALSLGTAVGGTFWPPSGLTLGVLLYAARTAWPRLVVAGLVANFTSDQLHGMSVPASLGFAAANLVEPYVAAYLLRRRAGKEIRLNRAADFIALGLVECFIAAPLASLIGALTVELWAATSPGFAMTFRTWWVGNAVGGLVL